MNLNDQNDSLTPAQATGLTVNQIMFYQGVTRSELAKRVGLSRPSISLKIAGEVGWSLDDLLSVADALGVAPQSLLPQQDEHGNWIPAPFVPGYAKAPALAGASAGWAHRESNPGPTD
ncbi:helix-turn-helix domain-containing protein [Actinomyces sp.]|uniref:helix-turn-helix domain-containing protein n=1 Tax=Actinomyces sp. TaxID=29317 RepID=UPI0037C179DF